MGDVIPIEHKNTLRFAMSSVKIIHNPRCSKSRETLQLLRDNGVEPDVIEYLKTPLSKEELQAIFAKLDKTDVVQMMRTKESEFKEAGLDKPGVDDEQRFDAMVSFPKLIERPIVITNTAARIGRPPQAVLDIL